MALWLEDHVFRVLRTSSALPVSGRTTGRSTWTTALAFSPARKRRRSSPAVLQILGTESKESNSWLWAWANRSNIPDRLLAGTRMVKSEAEQAEVVE